MLYCEESHKGQDQEYTEERKPGAVSSKRNENADSQQREPVCNGQGNIDADALRRRKLQIKSSGRGFMGFLQCQR